MARPEAALAQSGAAGGRFGELAAVFLRLGATASGGPAAHIALMEDEVVRRRRWMSREEFLDLLGATNLVPGPNSTEMAIHIGRRRAGWPGLVVAGACFILPAVAIVWGLAWDYVRYRRLPAVEGLLYGVKPVVIAVIVQALWSLGGSALKSRSLVLAAVIAVGLSLAGAHELVILFGTGLAFAAGQRVVTGGQVSGAAVVSPVSALGLAAIGGAQPFPLSTLFLVFLKVGAVLFGSRYVLLAFLRAELVTRLGWPSERPSSSSP